MQTKNEVLQKKLETIKTKKTKSVERLEKALNKKEIEKSWYIKQNKKETPTTKTLKKSKEIVKKTEILKKIEIKKESI